MGMSEKTSGDKNMSLSATLKSPWYNNLVRTWKSQPSPYKSVRQLDTSLFLDSSNIFARITLLLCISCYLFHRAGDFLMHSSYHSQIEILLPTT